MPYLDSIELLITVAVLALGFIYGNYLAQIQIFTIVNSIGALLRIGGSIGRWVTEHRSKKNFQLACEILYWCRIVALGFTVISIISQTLVSYFGIGSQYYYNDLKMGFC